MLSLRDWLRAESGSQQSSLLPAPSGVTAKAQSQIDSRQPPRPKSLQDRLAEQKNPPGIRPVAPELANLPDGSAMTTRNRGGRSSGARALSPGAYRSASDTPISGAGQRSSGLALSFGSRNSFDVGGFVPRAFAGGGGGLSLSRR